MLMHLLWHFLKLREIKAMNRFRKKEYSNTCSHRCCSQSFRHYNLSHVINHNLPADDIDNIKIILNFKEIPSIFEVYGWALFSKSHTGLIFDEGSNSFALTYLQKDGLDNILPSDFKSDEKKIWKILKKQILFHYILDQFL